jgi:hypothetical protein
MVSRIFAGDMWLVRNFGDPNEQYRRFLDNGRERFLKLIDSLILYDQIVIPTDNFHSMAAIVDVLGSELTMELLDADILSFARAQNQLIYIGNGGGLKFMASHMDANKKSKYVDIEEAVKSALFGLNSLAPHHVRPLTQKIAAKTTDLLVDEGVMTSIQNEIKANIDQSKYLRKKYKLRGDLSRLPGIGPDQVRTYGGADCEDIAPDKIASILKIAHTNLQMSMANRMSCNDLSTDSSVAAIVRGNAMRTKHQASSTGLSSIKKLIDIPDFLSGATVNRELILALINIRQTVSGEEFRKWFHAALKDDSKEINKAFVDLVRQIPASSSLPVRALRFAITTTIGVYSTPVGVLAGGVDCFGIEQFLNRRKPKFFIDNLTSLHTKRRGRS